MDRTKFEFVIDDNHENYGEFLGELFNDLSAKIAENKLNSMSICNGFQSNSKTSTDYLCYDQPNDFSFETSLSVVYLFTNRHLYIDRTQIVWQKCQTNCHTLD